MSEPRTEQPSRLTVLAGPVPGTVYVGGKFTTYNGATVPGLVLLRVSDGSRVTTFAPAGVTITGRIVCIDHVNVDASSPDAQRLVENVMRDHFDHWLAESPQEADKLGQLGDRLSVERQDDVAGFQMFGGRASRIAVGDLDPFVDIGGRDAQPSGGGRCLGRGRRGPGHHAGGAAHAPAARR